MEDTSKCIFEKKFYLMYFQSITQHKKIVQLDILTEKKMDIKHENCVDYLDNHQQVTQDLVCHSPYDANSLIYEVCEYCSTKLIP